MGKVSGKKISWSDLSLVITSYGLVFLVCVIMLYPFMNVIAVAFSSHTAFLKNPLMIFPQDLNFDAFRIVFSSPLMYKSYGNTLFVTIVGTVLSLFLMTLTAYPLSRPELKGKKIFMTYYLVVFVFSAGIIPSFLVMKGIGLYNTLWALIFPSILPIYYLILMKSFFESIPNSLVESARVDGASEIHTFLKIILPLSKPALAAIGLFQAVLYWNSYFQGVVYIRDIDKWPLQLYLRQIIMAADAAFSSAGGNLAELEPDSVPAVSIQYASLIVVILPIIMVYPFIQKYFVKGVMVGAVKG